MGNWIYIILGFLVLLIAISYIYYEQVYLDEGVIEESESGGDGKLDFSKFGFSKRDLFIYFGLLGVGFIFAIIFLLFKRVY